MIIDGRVNAGEAKWHSAQPVDQHDTRNFGKARNPRLIEDDFRNQSRQPIIYSPVKPTREAQSRCQTEQHRR